FGKIARDQLGPRAFVNGNPDEGMSDEYRALVKQLQEDDTAWKKARAGTDANELSPEDRAEAAQLAGVPADPRNFGLPDTSTMSTKVRTKYYQDEQKAIEKAQGEYGAADEQTRAALRALDEFQRLNAVTHTGQDLAPWYLGGLHAGPHGVGADMSQEHGGLN